MWLKNIRFGWLIHVVRILSSVSLRIFYVDWVQILCKREYGSELYKCSPGPDFISVVRVRILSRIESSGSASGFYCCSPGPGPGPDYIIQSPSVSPDVFVVRLRILSICFSSGSGSESRSVSGSVFYSIRVRVRVRILSNMSGSGFYQHPSKVANRD